MSALEQNLIRVELDVTQYAMPGSLVNLFTGRPPVLARSRAHRIEVVVIKNDELDPDVGNITSITCDVKAYQQPESGALIQVTEGVINSALDGAGRANRTDQHAVISFTEGQTGLNMSGADANGFKKFHMVFTAIRNGKRVSLAWGEIEMLNDGGVYAGDTPTPGDPTFLTADETIAMMGGYIKAGLNDPGKTFTLQSINGHKWQQGVNPDGERIDSIGQ
jgi:hypothetical protein